jgi:Na+/H+ antiporter NhaD/arsenite permease-like protein
MEAMTLLLALLAMVPVWVWWLLAVLMVHGWAIGLPERSIESYDVETNTLKRNGKRDFPMLFFWVHVLLIVFCGYVLAPLYSPYWLLGGLYFAIIVWINRHAPRRREAAGEEDRSCRSAEPKEAVDRKGQTQVGRIILSKLSTKLLCRAELTEAEEVSRHANRHNRAG